MELLCTTNTVSSKLCVFRPGSQVCHHCICASVVSDVIARPQASTVSMTMGCVYRKVSLGSVRLLYAGTVSAVGLLRAGETAWILLS